MYAVAEEDDTVLVCPHREGDNEWFLPLSTRHTYTIRVHLCDMEFVDLPRPVQEEPSSPAEGTNEQPEVAAPGNPRGAVSPPPPDRRGADDVLKPHRAPGESTESPEVPNNPSAGAPEATHHLDNHPPVVHPGNHVNNIGTGHSTPPDGPSNSTVGGVDTAALVPNAGGPAARDDDMPTVADDNMVTFAHDDIPAVADGDEPFATPIEQRGRRGRKRNGLGKELADGSPGGQQGEPGQPRDSDTECRAHKGKRAGKKAEEGEGSTGNPHEHGKLVRCRGRPSTHPNVLWLFKDVLKVDEELYIDVWEWPVKKRKGEAEQTGEGAPGGDSEEEKGEENEEENEGEYWDEIEEKNEEENEDEDEGDGEENGEIKTGQYEEVYEEEADEEEVDEVKERNKLKLGYVRKRGRKANEYDTSIQCLCKPDCSFLCLSPAHFERHVTGARHDAMSNIIRRITGKSLKRTLAEELAKRKNKDQPAPEDELPVRRDEPGPMARVPRTNQPALTGIQPAPLGTSSGTLPLALAGNQPARLVGERQPGDQRQPGTQQLAPGVGGMPIRRSDQPAAVGGTRATGAPGPTGPTGPASGRYLRGGGAPGPRATPQPEDPRTLLPAGGTMAPGVPTGGALTAGVLQWEVDPHPHPGTEDDPRLQASPWEPGTFRRDEPGQTRVPLPGHVSLLEEVGGADDGFTVRLCTWKRLHKQDIPRKDKCMRESVINLIRPPTGQDQDYNNFMEPQGPRAAGAARPARDPRGASAVGILGRMNTSSGAGPSRQVPGAAAGTAGGLNLDRATTFVFAMSHRGLVVAAALFRCFGTALADVPFFAAKGCGGPAGTSERANVQRLLWNLQGVLRALGMCKVVLHAPDQDKVVLHAPAQDGPARRGGSGTRESLASFLKLRCGFRRVENRERGDLEYNNELFGFCQGDRPLYVLEAAP
eukprot:jgi/Mesvir1/22359/Mv17861-RA.1